MLDAGAPDAGPPDAGTPDAGAPDAGAPACSANFSGCTQASFDNNDRTAAGASRMVSFTCCSYSPDCMKIKVNQSVTFSGSFFEHPLAHACGPAQVIANNAGPFTFTTPGIYGYYCTAHGGINGSGMAGAIQVVP
jgi:plastocyanin